MEKDEEPFLDSTGCNKMIMIVTDGATETALNVFQSRNWYPNNVSTCHPIEVNHFLIMIMLLSTLFRLACSHI